MPSRSVFRPLSMPFLPPREPLHPRLRPIPVGLRDIGGEFALLSLSPQIRVKESLRLPFASS
ncbi:hypothetical protein J6590_091272 [Homalodisca vitripennis]|nr:hypothetical protein J6590_091272 [Homalodisca vitripennis]